MEIKWNYFTLLITVFSGAHFVVTQPLHTSDITDRPWRYKFRDSYWKPQFFKGDLLVFRSIYSSFHNHRKWIFLVPPRWVSFATGVVFHFHDCGRKGNFRSLFPIASMGRTVYLLTWMVDFYGFHVGKYTVRPMDGMGLVFLVICLKHRISHPRGHPPQVYLLTIGSHPTLGLADHGEKSSSDSLSSKLNKQIHLQKTKHGNAKRIHVWYICLHLVDVYGKCE